MADMSRFVDSLDQLSAAGWGGASCNRHSGLADNLMSISPHFAHRPRNPRTGPVWAANWTHRAGRVTCFITAGRSVVRLMFERCRRSPLQRHDLWALGWREVTDRHRFQHSPSGLCGVLGRPHLWHWELDGAVLRGGAIRSRQSRMASGLCRNL